MKGQSFFPGQLLSDDLWESGIFCVIFDSLFLYPSGLGPCSTRLIRQMLLTLWFTVNAYSCWEVRGYLSSWAPCILMWLMPIKPRRTRLQWISPVGNVSHVSSHMIDGKIKYVPMVYFGLHPLYLSHLLILICLLSL